MNKIKEKVKLFICCIVGVISYKAMTNLVPSEYAMPVRFVLLGVASILVVVALLIYGRKQLNTHSPSEPIK